MIRGPSPVSLALRMERYIERVPLSGCWIWTGAISRDGYGKVGVRLATGCHNIIPAHRASWQVHNGLIPAGMWVLHHCDVRCCVNPGHLYIGTARDNSNDTLTRRGRIGAPSPGIRNGAAKLTPEIASRIRSLYPAHSQDALALMFRVGQSTISRVIRERVWSLPAPEVGSAG